MGSDRQLEQLCSVYAERSDAELLGLHENRDDLTDLAQQALAQVMKERGISASGVPVSLPEEDVDPGDAVLGLGEEEAEIVRFFDAFQTSEALRVLTQAEIAHRVVDLDSIDPRSEATRGQRVQLAVVVAKLDELRAQQVLQETMRLFPAPEGDTTLHGKDVLVMVDVFSRDEALRVAQALGGAGVCFVWNDGREDLSLEEEEIRIEVYQRQHERASKLAQQALGSE